MIWTTLTFTFAACDNRFIGLIAVDIADVVEGKNGAKFNRALREIAGGNSAICTAAQSFAQSKACVV